MKIEVSNGEILDKISILEIKKEFITDTTKLANVEKEYTELIGLFIQLVTTTEASHLYKHLYAVNRELWIVEDQLRDLEHIQDFGPTFVAAARSVYKLNDKRAAYKKQINILTNSNLTEEKSYANYENIS
jgi:hypothetical protein